MFDKIISDTDTPLFRAAKSVQQDYVLVRNKSTDVTREFPNNTAFWGHHAKKEGGWLNEVGEFLGSHWSAEEFEITPLSRLHPDIPQGQHLKEAERKFDFFVGGLKKLGIAHDYELVIGGGENFRYECAQILPYKGERKDKPLLFKELTELVKNKYRNKLTVTDGIEADDYLAMKGWENYQHYKRTNRWKYVLSFVDKDLKQIISPIVCPDKKEEGVKMVTPEQAAYSYAMQLLVGDKSTDNIQGLPSFTKEVKERYNLKNVRGVGEATAEKFLEGCNVKEMFERVVEAYKSFYGERKSEFTSHRGEKFHWNWLDYLQDNARLLYLLREKGEVYHITSTLDKLGVKY